MQYEARLQLMRILVKMIDSCCVEAACTAFDAVNLITFVQQKLSKVRTILPSDARDQSFLAMVLLAST